MGIQVPRLKKENPNPERNSFVLWTADREPIIRKR
jgi:hypothetical protein